MTLVDGPPSSTRLREGQRLSLRGSHHVMGSSSTEVGGLQAPSSADVDALFLLSLCNRFLCVFQQALVLLLLITAVRIDVNSDLVP